MAPPPIRSQPDASAIPSRQEALAGQANENEHGKRGNHKEGDHMKNRANPQVNVVEVGSSSGSDGESIGKRSPSPESRAPLGGAELQRPPKFFHENDGMHGMAGPDPNAKLPLAHAAANPPDHSSGFFKQGTVGKSPMDNNPCHGPACSDKQKRTTPSTKKLKAGSLDRDEGLPGVEDDAQHHHADEGTIGVKDQGFGPPADSWLAETHDTFSRHLRQDHLPARGSGFFKSNTIGSIPMDDTFCQSGDEKLRKRCFDTLGKRKAYSSKNIGSLDHEEGLPGVEDDIEHHHDDEGILGVATNGVSNEAVNLDNAAASAPGAMNLQQDQPPDHSGGFFKEGTVGSIEMDDTNCHGEECSNNQKRTTHSTKKLEAGALDHEEGLPSVEDDVEHHHDDERTIGIADQNTAEQLNLDEAAASAPGAMNLQKDNLPDHSGGFFKEGSAGPILMGDTNCHGDECTTVQRRNDRAEEGYEVKPEGFVVSSNDWNSAIHGAVSWAFQNKLKGAAQNQPGTERLAGVPEGGAFKATFKTPEVEANAPVVRPELDETAIEAEAEEMVKLYYSEHPDEKAKVMEALGELAKEQKDLGNNEAMEQLIKEGAAAADNNSPQAANVKRGLHNLVNKEGKGKHHHHPRPLDPTSEEGLSGVEEDGIAEPIPLDEAARQAAADEALIKGDVPESHVEGTEWTKGIDKNDENDGIPEQPQRPAPGPPRGVDLDEAAAQAPDAMMLNQDHAPDHSGGFLKEGTVGSIPMDDTACHGDDACLTKRNVLHDVVNHHGKGEEHYHPAPLDPTADEGLTGVKEEGTVDEEIDRAEAEAQAPGAHMLHQDHAPDHSGGFLKEGTVGSIPMDDTACHGDETCDVAKRGENAISRPCIIKSGVRSGYCGNKLYGKQSLGKHLELIEKRTGPIHELVNEKGKGRHHYHPENQHVSEEGLHSVPNHGFAEPVPQDEAAKQAAADEALHRSSQAPPHIEDISIIHGLPEAKEGPPVDLDEAAAHAPGAHMLHQDYPPDHSGGFLKEGTVGSISMDDTACHGDCLKRRGLHNLINEKGKGKQHSHPENEHVAEEGLHSVQDGGFAEPVDQEKAAKNWAAHEALLKGVVKPQSGVEDDEWTKGIDKHDENDGNPVPKHAKRLDLNDWRADGQDQIDAKFSQHLGETGKKKHHKGGKHHSKEHHSTTHHQTSTIHAVSYSAPPRAPGHKLPTSTHGSYRFTQTVGTGDASAIPTVPVTSGAYAPKPMHTAAVSWMTSAAPSPYRVAISGTVPHPRATAKTTAAVEPALRHGYPMKPVLGNHNTKVPVSSAHPAEQAIGKGGAHGLSHGNKPEYEPIANHGSPAFEDDYRAYEKINAATLNSVSPDSSTAQLLAESERAATELDRGPAKGKSSSQVDKRSNNRNGREKELKGHKLREFNKNVMKKQEEDMYGVVGQQAPVITSEEYAAIQAEKNWEEKPPGAWGRFTNSWSNKVMKFKGHTPEPERVNFRKNVDAPGEHLGPKAKVWAAATTGDDATSEVQDKPAENKLGKRHIPQVKEEEDAKMRGYASSRHLAGTASRKDRQKAAQSVKEIAKNFEEDRAAAQYAAEHRAEKMIEKAEAKASQKAKGKGGKAVGKPLEYHDHNTYDPIKAHAAEDEEALLEDDMREGAWTDVQGGELVDYSTGGHRDKGFADHQLGSAAATGLPNSLGGGNMAKNAGEIGDMGLMLIIGAWVTILIVILKVARRRTEGETGWLKGRRPSKRTDAQYLEDIEEGGMEKRYD